MSAAHLQAAWTARLTTTRKIVLLAMADIASEEGRCWPTIGAIATACALNRGTVMRSIAELELSGLLRVERATDRTRRTIILDLDAMRGALPTPPLPESVPG